MQTVYILWNDFWNTSAGFLFFNAFWFCWKSLLEYSESWVIHLNIDQITGTNAFDICLLDI